MIRMLFGVFALLVLYASNPALGQSFPGKSMRILVASPPGNPSDVVMRAAAKELSGRFGVPVIVENRVGASEIVMQEACAKAAPDGNTLCNVSKDGLSFNPHLYAKLPYDVEKDYRPVAMLYFLIEFLVSSATVPVSTLKELQGLAAAKPGSLNFGTRGLGSQQDMFREYLAQRWKTDIVGVHYKGTNFVIAALVSGEVHFGELSLSTIAGPLQAGKIKVLAVNVSGRLPSMPEAPTFTEAGFVDAPTRPWWGIAVPASTPDAAVARLNAELVRLVREPAFAKFLEARGLEPAVGSVEEFASFLKRDRDQVGQIVKKFNLPRQ
jgi:tripartite-type tricarboxylate transporter receptor subunit TctC